jgi:hypothetical protein
MMPLRTKIGDTHGRLTVIAEAGREKLGGSVWICVCSCGNEVKVLGRLLRSGATKSCGCLRVKHGHSRKDANGKYNGTPTYQSWKAMWTRCTNPNAKDWYLYGERGIRVCARWHIFENFLADMGERPVGLTLDRKNVDKNYTPTNCRWATRSTQAKNRRRYKQKRPWSAAHSYNHRKSMLRAWARRKEEKS